MQRNGDKGWNRERHVGVIKKKKRCSVSGWGGLGWGLFPSLWMCLHHHPPSPLLSSGSLPFLVPIVCLVAFSQEINWPLACPLSCPSVPHQPTKRGQVFTAVCQIAKCALFLTATCCSAASSPLFVFPPPPAQHKPAFKLVNNLWRHWMWL